MPAQTQDINNLLNISDSLYDVVMVIARRSRQINEEFYQKKRDRQILEELEGGFDEEYLQMDSEENDNSSNNDDYENPINYALVEFKDLQLDYEFESSDK